MTLKAKVLGKIHLHNKNKFSPEKKKKKGWELTQMVLAQKKKKKRTGICSNKASHIFFSFHRESRRNDD